MTLNKTSAREESKIIETHADQVRAQFWFLRSVCERVFKSNWGNFTPATDKVWTYQIWFTMKNDLCGKRRARTAYDILTSVQQVPITQMHLNQPPFRKNPCLPHNVVRTILPTQGRECQLCSSGSDYLPPPTRLASSRDRVCCRFVLSLHGDNLSPIASQESNLCRGGQ
jgi:hypothetical protein